MKVDLKGYTALITGGSSGLGFEMAKALLLSGARVVIAARAGERLEKAKEALAQAGDACAVAMDVRDASSVEEAAAWFRERFDRLDMLVCDAGIGNNAPGMEDLPPDHAFWDIRRKPSGRCWKRTSWASSLRPAASCPSWSGAAGWSMSPPATPP